MAKCGYCIENRHTLCPRKWQKFIPEYKKSGKTKVFGITWLNEWTKCSCEYKNHRKTDVDNWNLPD